ncbi:hypothetical protein GCM10010267_10710 [Streptomyces griseorubens]|nr:hypothetical protein GCM10010267_10710 [Streptomyces griseorubens]
MRRGPGEHPLTRTEADVISAACRTTRCRPVGARLRPDPSRGHRPHGVRLAAGRLAHRDGRGGRRDREQLRDGDYTKGVTSTLAMQVAGTPTFLGTGGGTGRQPGTARPVLALMRRRLDEGGGEEDLTGVIDLLLRRPE